MRAGLRALVAAGLLAAALPAAARTGADAALPEAAAAGEEPLFVAIAARYFDRDAAAVARLAARWSDPDDLAVGLFVAARSARAPERVFALRERAGSWWEVGVACGLPADDWFVPVTRDPGPPYGKAYGHWRKLRDGGAPFPGLADPQARDLVAVRLLHEYFGVAPETAMSWRAGGRDVRALAVAEYRKRHGAAPSAPAGPDGKKRGRG